MADWLGSYDYRIKLTLDDTNIDSDLTNFPVLVKLGASVGQGSDDTTAVFDALNSSPCVWNSADKGSITLSNGDLTVVSTADYEMVRATLGKSSGKWYWETTIDVMTASYFVGVANSSADLNNQVGYDTNGWSYKANDGNKFTNNSGSSYGSTYTVGDVISVALDMDNGKVWFAKNGTWQNSGNPVAGTNEAFSSLSGTLYPADGPRTSADGSTTNFGASKFAYTMPSGFSALDDGWTNRKKIAITTSDGLTECYVEIERWDDANEVAFLWVKVPSILASGGAVLYLYYDSTADSNTSYIGDIGDTPAQTVWDSNFVFVCHMAQDPADGGAGDILDSTSNGNDGTAVASMTSADLVDSAIDKGIDFDGSDDEIDFSNDSSLDVTGNYTIEAIAEGHSSANWERICGRYDDGANPGFCLSKRTDDYITLVHWLDGANYNNVISSGTHTSGYKYLAGTFIAGTGSELWINGVSDATDTSETVAISSFSQNFIIGAQDYTTARNWLGEIDEVRLSNIARSDAWIKATYYSNSDDLVTFGGQVGWLSDWDKRIELTIDDSNVSSDLTDFPVMLYLSTASGIGDVDVSPIFDELTSDANRKKIAVTTSDGETQCYVEIENWDDASEIAQLWVKVPSILASGGATLYLYYDAAKSDNTTYVGDTDSTPAQSVWDSDFALVYHMNQDPNGDGADAIKDSTSNNNDGTPAGSMTTADLVAGPYGGKAIDFEGTDDEINFTMISSATMTIELRIWVDAESGVWDMFCGADGVTTDFFGNYQSGTYLRIRANNSDANVTYDLGSVTGQWLNLVAILDGTNWRLMVDGSSIGTAGMTQVLDVDTLMYGFTTASYHVDGKVAEFRISDAERTQNWIIATHYSNTDAIVTFGAEEEFILSETTTVDLASLPLNFTLSFVSGIVAGESIALSAPISCTTELLASKVQFVENLTAPLSCTLDFVAGVVTNLIGRDLWEFNSYITKILERDSDIEKITSKDSRITKLFDRDSSVR